MNLKVVAEGIETEGERSYLLDHFCDEMQGYLIGKPVSSEAFEELLENQFVKGASS